MSRPTCLVYCHHSLGMGHLVRTLALGGALAREFEVVLLNGGPWPESLDLPSGIERVDLPPVTMDDRHRLVSRDPHVAVDEARGRRRELVVATYRRVRPAVLVLELFPFGRRKFADELLPMLDEAREAGADRPLVVCSLRDLLVTGRSRQRDHDDWAVEVANRYFDLVAVHADPTFARLEDSLASSIPLNVPVEYTGFVTAAGRSAEDGARPDRQGLVVSAGGGLVGESLFRTALSAHALIWSRTRLAMTLVAGPFLPESIYRDLSRLAAGRAGVRLVRTLPDLPGELARAAASVSQCGYNTALELIGARVPALVVPYGDPSENEQWSRARRLEQLGLVRILPGECLTPSILAARILDLLAFQPAPVQLRTDGAAATTRLLTGLVTSSRHGARQEVTV